MLNPFHKLNCFAVGLCLLATLSAFVLVAGGHRESVEVEENNSEFVEFEEIEVINERTERRSVIRRLYGFSACQAHVGELVTSTRIQKTISICGRSERDCLNGIGAYLRA